MDTALNWLEGLPRFSILKYNFYRTWLLLKTVIPEYTEMDVFFITGSKGKGTVAATLAAILRASGVSTGLVTSPHLISVCERINLNGSDITEAELAACLRRIKCQLPPLPRQFGTWIYSEVLTAASLLWFRDQGAGTVVLEAGLGGRLDPGNVFRRPYGTCISSVYLEHKGILGDTLAEIAAEKAGVIKPCTPLVTGADGAALDVIKKRAAVFSAPVYVWQHDFNWQQTGETAVLNLPGKILRFCPGFETAASRINKAMAARLASFHPWVTDHAIVQGIMAPGLPGRFEILPGTPDYVLDVGHTPESVVNLVEGIRTRFPRKRLIFVAGFLADKSVREMLEIMVSAAEKVYYAPVQDRRSFDTAAVNVPDADRASTIAAAINKAAVQGDVICVTGSFSAVREARLLLSKGR